jgi:hypothetical protein
MTLQCLVEATDYEVPHSAVVSILLYFPILRYKYSPQHLLRTSSNRRGVVKFDDLTVLW